MSILELNRILFFLARPICFDYCGTTSIVNSMEVSLTAGGACSESERKRGTLGARALFCGAILCTTQTLE
jgi:hypothetical protein